MFYGMEWRWSNDHLHFFEDTDEGTSTRDVGLIMAAQKVEHYEIATYGGLAQLAETLIIDKTSMGHRLIRRIFFGGHFTCRPIFYYAGK